VTGPYVVAGTCRETLDVGRVQNTTEGGTWVFWRWSCCATVFADSPDATFHATYEDAEAEANRRWNALKSSSPARR